jgi:predicted transcriptional regulator of viral defense system
MDFLNMSNGNSKNVTAKILETARNQSVFRAGDVRDVCDPRSTLRRMMAQGKLVQVGPGLYALPDADVGVNHTLAETAKRHPGGVICLISALAFHGIGTQIPYETWVMRRDRKMPPQKGASVRFVYCTGSAFFHSIEEHTIEGVTVQVYAPAKTVADCFKYRNKIGLDVAIEALREGRRGKRFTMDELWTAARVCRVQGVIQPYLEMLAQ